MFLPAPFNGQLQPRLVGIGSQRSVASPYVSQRTQRLELFRVRGAASAHGTPGFVETEPFSVGGTTIRPGDYTMSALSLSHSTNPAKVLAGNVRVSRGGYFAGTRTSVSGGVVWTPDEHFSFDASWQRNDISLATGDVVAEAGRLRVDVTPSTSWSGSATVQYDGLAREWINSLRVRFIHAPLSDAYLVFEERRTRSPSVTDRTLALKVTRMFAF